MLHVHIVIVLFADSGTKHSSVEHSSANSGTKRSIESLNTANNSGVKRYKVLSKRLQKMPNKPRLPLCKSGV